MKVWSLGLANQIGLLHFLLSFLVIKCLSEQTWNQPASNKHRPTKDKPPELLQAPDLSLLTRNQVGIYSWSDSSMTKQLISWVIPNAGSSSSDVSQSQKLFEYVNIWTIPTLKTGFQHKVPQYEMDETRCKFQINLLVIKWSRTKWRGVNSTLVGSSLHHWRIFNNKSCCWISNVRAHVFKQICCLQNHKLTHLLYGRLGLVHVPVQELVVF